MTRNLPPLKSLVAFESVVRLGSITKASEELFVTHGAISKQVTALEDWLGRPLFLSNRKLMLPTAEGIALARAAGEAWDLIEAALAPEKGTAEVLTVIAPSTFAMRWLIPRVWSFAEAHADIAVQVRQTDSLESWLDIPFDVAIRTGRDLPAHLVASSFLEEELILAVAPQSPALIGLDSPQDLPSRPLLGAETRPGELERWLVAAGVDPAGCRVTKFPHFYLALEAALAGVGPVVCPRATLGDLLAKGELVEPFPQIRIAGPTYVALYDASRTRMAAARTFVDWLAAAATSRTPRVSADDAVRPGNN